MSVDLKGKRILVVEDQYLVADDLKRLLEEFGAAVIGPVARLDDALRMIAHADIDLALLDINLEGEMAYPAADELLRRGVRFLFVTGYALDSMRSAYRSIPRLQKPYDAAALKAALLHLVHDGG